MGLGGLAYGGSITPERLTASMTAYQPKIANQIKTRRPMNEFMMRNKKLYSGGTEVGIRIRYRRSGKIADSGGVGVWSYYDELSTTPTDTVKAIGERFSNLNAPIVISMEEEWENDGEKMFDRLKEQTTFAEDDLGEDVNDVAWGISGGDGNKLPTPVTDIVSGTDSLTLYGIAKSSTSNTHMNSQEVNSVGDLETELLDAMREGELLVIDNSPNMNDKIDGWMTHRDVYLGLEKILPQYVQVSSTKDADLGFDQIIFNKVPIRWDSDCPLDSDQKYQMFGFVLKYWETAIRRQNNFKVTPFVSMLPKQYANAAQLGVSLAFVCNNPRTNVRIKGIEL